MVDTGPCRPSAGTPIRLADPGVAGTVPRRRKTPFERARAAARLPASGCLRSGAVRRFAGELIGALCVFAGLLGRTLRCFARKSIRFVDRVLRRPTSGLLRPIF